MFKRRKANRAKIQAAQQAHRARLDPHKEASAAVQAMAGMFTGVPNGPAYGDSPLMAALGIHRNMQALHAFNAGGHPKPAGPPAALDIQDGQYYRRRDGQKAGPMRPSGQAAVYTWYDPSVGNAGNVAALYTANGRWRSQESENIRDLIAPWTEAPQVPAIPAIPAIPASPPAPIAWAPAEPCLTPAALAAAWQSMLLARQARQDSGQDERSAALLAAVTVKPAGPIKAGMTCVISGTNTNDMQRANCMQGFSCGDTVKIVNDSGGGGKWWVQACPPSNHTTGGYCGADWLKPVSTAPVLDPLTCELRVGDTVRYLPVAQVAIECVPEPWVIAKIECGQFRGDKIGCCNTYDRNLLTLVSRPFSAPKPDPYEDQSF